MDDDEIKEEIKKHSQTMQAQIRYGLAEGLFIQVGQDRYRHSCEEDFNLNEEEIFSGLECVLNEFEEIFKEDTAE